MSDQKPATPAENLAKRLTDLAQGGGAVTVTYMIIRGEHLLLSEKVMRVERLGRENSDIDKNQ